MEVFTDFWTKMKEQVKSQMTALLIQRMEKGFPRNKIANYEHGYEDGYREALMALPKLWETAVSELKSKQRVDQMKEKQTQRLNRNKKARII